MNRPRIGITVDNRHDTAASGQYESAIAYSRAVAEEGGLPLLLPQEPALAPAYVELCDGLLLTGGSDAVVEAFGAVTDPRSRRLDPGRQAFELALLDALAEREDKPVLGVCLGMQLMALHAGGALNQYLPDTLPNAEAHQGDRRHPVVFCVDDAVLPPAEGEIVSSHRQAVSNPGRLRAIATAPDGTIEAVDLPKECGGRFYLGVQWHPERGDAGPLNRGVIRRLIDAARSAR